MVLTNEENVGIYRQYILYREGSTRYFVEKNWRGDISTNIAKISAIYQLEEIYRRFFEKIASSGKISAKYRRNIGDKSSIFWQYFPSFMQRDLMAQITLVLIRQPRRDSNGNMVIQRPDCSQFFIQWPKLIFNSKLMFQRLFWPKFLL